MGSFFRDQDFPFVEYGICHIAFLGHKDRHLKAPFKTTLCSLVGIGDHDSCMVICELNIFH